jgi:hypothetical protein
VLCAGVADPVGRDAQQVGEPVSPVIDPGVAGEKLVDQTIAFGGVGRVDEGSELLRSRDAAGQVEIDAAAELIVVRERRVRNFVALPGLEKVAVD